MFRPTFRRPARLALAALALVATAAACNDSTGPEEDPADDVAAIRLTVQGTQPGVYTITETGTLTPSPLVLPTFGSSTVTATFLDASGADITSDIDPLAYELRLTGLPAGVNFNRTAAFSGTLQSSTPGTGTGQLSLFHIQEGHTDLGPFPVAMQVGG